jgi:1,4-dihydroxy-2-naphthoate octaprenyltransferase
VVFVFFGPVAVVGTYYVQARTASPAVWLASIPVGLLITAILVVNNLRDIHTDAATGKHTLAVRLGETGTRWEYLLCLGAAYLSVAVMVAFNQAPVGALLICLSLPFGERVRRVVFNQSGRALNPALGMTGQLALVFALLMGAGWILL